MTVRELIKALVDQPLGLDAQVYVGKGMGPAETVEPASTGDRLPVLVISPGLP